MSATVQKNAGDEQQVRSAKEKERIVREQQLSDMLALLSLPEGRRTIWRMLEFCGIHRQSATQSGSWTYFNEGQRSVGNMLLTEIVEASPESYILMMKENGEKRK